MVIESADKVAPADIQTLMSNHLPLSHRASGVAAPTLPLFRSQLELALACLRDHCEGRCPQIPYRTISILGAALLYVADQYDLIPDFLPRTGCLDDAAILATAFELARPGLERYCAFTDRAFPQLTASATPPPARGSKGKR